MKFEPVEKKDRLNRTKMNIRKADRNDLSRIAEIYVFNNRINYFPIFQDEGFTEIKETEICKLYVDTCFQGEGIGDQLIRFAMEKFGADHLWALEKNTRAISFYHRHGFRLTGQKEFEEGTTEYIVELKRRDINKNVNCVTVHSSIIEAAFMLA